MIIVTSESVAGYRSKKTIGEVFGVVVRSRGIGGNLMAGLRSIAGGEIQEYSTVPEEARGHAISRFQENDEAVVLEPA